MDLSRPYSVLATGAEGDVLRVLTGSTKPFTGREIARLAGIAHTTAQRALDRLATHGLISHSRAGRASLYALNRQHLAADLAIELTALRSRLVARLREEIAGWRAQPVHASLFGSAARGDGGTESDVDLFLVRPDDVDDAEGPWPEQVALLADQVLAWTGNRASIVEMRQSEIMLLVFQRRPLFAELLNDSIGLAGAELRRLRR
jgi:hypothetical protein